MIRETLAGLEGRLDEVRRQRAWRAIAGRLDAAPAEPLHRRPWLLAAVAIIALAAVATAAVVRERATAHVVAPAAPASAVPSCKPVPASASPEPRALAPAPPPALAPAPPPARPAHVPTAGELYRRAETALARRDATAARAWLERLVREHPRDALVDAARFDLALIAQNTGDIARARLLVDEILVSGRDATIRAAAEQLLERL